MLLYTVIHHDIRRHFKLSLSEYCIVDSIYHLQNNISYGAWCVMSRKKMADSHQISERGLVKILNKLTSAKIIIRDKERGYLRVCQSFCTKMQEKKVSGPIGDEYYSPRVNDVPLGGEQSASKGVNKVHLGGEQNSPNSNSNSNKDSNRNNNLGPNENFQNTEAPVKRIGWGKR